MRSQTVEINNRKYLGSKYRLLNFITKVIRSKADKIDTFIDGFAGTGVVGNHFREFSNKVISNDILYSNYIINRAFLNSTETNVSEDKIITLLNNLNNSRPSKGYIYHNYGGSYFTFDNAALMDAIREKIEAYFQAGQCTEQEKCILLTSLAFAIDKVANTVGQYDAFLKHLGKDSYDNSGKHFIDSSVYKRIVLKLPKIEYDGNNEVYNRDLNDLIKTIRGDILYLDPPYNGRQYIDCYHVLENIMRWNKPKLYGITKKFARNNLKSDYSKKREAVSAFKELVAYAKADHIFLSYNSEGIIPDDRILEILGSKGKIEVFEQDYSIFGNGAGRSVKRDIKERLFYCRVNI